VLLFPKRKVAVRFRVELADSVHKTIGFGPGSVRKLPRLLFSKQDRFAIGRVGGSAGVNDLKLVRHPPDEISLISQGVAGIKIMPPRLSDLRQDVGEIRGKLILATSSRKALSDRFRAYSQSSVWFSGILSLLIKPRRGAKMDKIHSW
jgi:hypothetical protein